jgi:hypothetical protein
MKVHKWWKMSDELDGYLSKLLKNWAVRQPLPKDGRERLLRAAVAAPAIPVQSGHLAIFDFLIKYFAAQTRDYELISPLHDAVITPYSQSQVWSMELASSWHLAS